MDREHLPLLFLVVVAVLGLIYSLTSINDSNNARKDFCRSKNMEYYDWTVTTTSCFSEKDGEVRVFKQNNS